MVTIIFKSKCNSFFKKNLDRIDYNKLSSNPNPNAIKLLQKQNTREIKITPEQLNDVDYRYKINWEYLSANPNAIQLLKKNQDKINWTRLSSNSNPNAIQLLQKKENMHKIDWSALSSNPNAIHLLEQNPHKIYWEFLSANPNAIDLLKDRIEYENNLFPEEYKSLKYKINWSALSANPSIFKVK